VQTLLLQLSVAQMAAFVGAATPVFIALRTLRLKIVSRLSESFLVVRLSETFDR
jgi:hypothetical protein